MTRFSAPTGWDTDSNAATTGSVAGVLLGTDALPARFVDPLQNRTRSALFGFDNSAISELAARTVRLALGHRSGTAAPRSLHR